MSLPDQTYIQNVDQEPKQKRFIEKFKSKLIELFFISSKKATKQNEMNKSKNFDTNYIASFSPRSSMNFKDNSISNYYYGYITMNVVKSSDANCDRKSIKHQRSSVSSISDSVSHYSIESSTKSSNTNENDTEPVYNNINKINPFSDTSLGELLSFKNLMNFSKFKSHFDTYMHTIDDENNFFDSRYMTNYISFILIENLSKSNFLLENNLNLVTNESYNQVKQIAREIFFQSECEPCGLKGCAIRIFLENDETDELIQMLCNFRFDKNSYLTSFQLDLNLKCHYSSHVKFKLNHYNQENQTENTLAKSLRSLISFKNNYSDENLSNICLSGRYDIKKIKLY